MIIIILMICIIIIILKDNNYYYSFTAHGIALSSSSTVYPLWQVAHSLALHHVDFDCSIANRWSSNRWIGRFIAFPRSMIDFKRSYPSFTILDLQATLNSSHCFIFDILRILQMYHSTCPLGWVFIRSINFNSIPMAGGWIDFFSPNSFCEDCLACLLACLPSFLLLYIRAK